MSDAPERIWLQWWGDGDPDEPGEVYLDEVTWQDERIFDHDVEFVRKDKVAELLDNIIVAYDLPGDHCELSDAIEQARRFLAGEEEA